MVVSKLISSPFWLLWALFPRPWALRVAACEACGRARHRRAGSAAPRRPRSAPLPGEGKRTCLGNGGWVMALLGVGKVALSVLQRDISQGRPSAGWLCESGPQTAWFHKSSAVLLAALPKWFGRNKTQIVGRQSTGTGGSWRAESKRSLCSVSFASLRAFKPLLRGVQDVPSYWSAGALWVCVCRKCLVTYIPAC